MSAGILSERSNSKGYFGPSSRGSFNPSQLATKGSDLPWQSTEMITTKNTRLNIIMAFGTPASNGYVARTIGTAALSPTQEIRSFCASPRWPRGNVRNTLIGRATNIKNKDSKSPPTHTETSWDGNTSRPRVKNIVICISQEMPS